jgi:glutathione-regulated potassium-efflux system ancillary protein KefC
LQPLTERGALGSRGGQATFAVLLFQDIAAIPLLALLPLISITGGRAAFSWTGLATASIAVVATLTVGHFLARPVFRHIARTRLREVFTAFALMLVLGVALGLRALRARRWRWAPFLAGVLLADPSTATRSRRRSSPSRACCCALFFISVGMSVDFGCCHDASAAHRRGSSSGMLVLKAGNPVADREGRRGLPSDERPLFVLLLAQGG